MPRHNRLSSFDLLFLCGLGLGSIGLVGALLLVPRGAGAAVAVVFPPGTNAGSAMTRVAAAGARLVRAGAYPFIVIARPDAPGFAARVRREGALIVIDAALVAGCASAAS